MTNNKMEVFLSFNVCLSYSRDSQLLLNLTMEVFLSFNVCLSYSRDSQLLLNLTHQVYHAPGTNKMTTCSDQSSNRPGLLSDSELQFYMPKPKNNTIKHHKYTD